MKGKTRKPADPSAARLEQEVQQAVRRIRIDMAYLRARMTKSGAGQLPAPEPPLNSTGPGDVNVAPPS